MNTITTGKQSINLDWYKASNKDVILGATTLKPDYSVAPTLPSQIKMTGEELIPSLLKKAVEISHDHTSPLISLPPIPSDSIPLTQHESAPDSVDEFSISRLSLQPDFIQTLNEYQEPSRIWQEAIIYSPELQESSQRRIKLTHSLSSIQTPDVMPFKRQRLGYKADSLPSEITVADSSEPIYTDVISFSWPRLVPKEIYEAEELARFERSEGLDPLLSGRMTRVHAELRKKWLAQSAVFPTLRDSITDIIDIPSSDSGSAAKKVVQSTISATTMIIGGAFGVIDGVFDGVVEVTEALGKATIGAAVGMVEKSAELLGEAIDYSSDAIENAKYSLHIGNRSSLEITRRLEEEERSRRMSPSYTVDPMVESRKVRVERELLSKSSSAKFD